jgi:hypothetical protein
MNATASSAAGSGHAGALSGLSVNSNSLLGVSAASWRSARASALESVLARRSQCGEWAKARGRVHIKTLGSCRGPN